MPGFEPYIVFSILLAIILSIAVSYYTYDNFEVAIVLFSISFLASAIFFDNNPVWINEEVESGIGSYLRAGMLVFSGGMGLIHFLKNGNKNKFALPIHIIVLLMFAVYSLVSSFYSIDIRTTVIRSILMTSVVLFLLGLNSWLDKQEKFKRLLNILFYTTSIIIFINFVSMFIIPTRAWWWKTPSRLLGIFSHPNSLGGFVTLSSFIIIWKIYNSKNITIPIISLFLGIIVLINTGSRTSMIMFALGLIIWFFLFRDWIKLSVLLLIIAIGIFLISQLGIASYSRNGISKITDLTEREYIWEASIPFVKRSPIIGYGYAVEGKIFANKLLYEVEDQFFNANAQQPLHNGYLSIFIGGGIIGLILWMIAILLPLIQSYNQDFSIYKAYALASIIPLLISNVVESAITGYLSASDIYFWIAWVVLGKIWIIKNNPNEIIFER